MAAMQKTFKCMNKVCGKEIKLERNADNSGWVRYELDGTTPHKCAANNVAGRGTPDSVAGRLQAIETRLTNMEKMLAKLLSQQQQK